ncbi:MAG: alpha/beta hydrolase [candidate division WOR-3 bacterium]|nr:MAG: alpha/beta hydrolase [candidate division WOR-3 bacterium]
MKMFLQIIKWAASISAGLLFLIFIGLLTYRVYLEKSTKIKTANGISLLEEITLGGLKQWIFIRGTDQKNPVLIFLHGGPGEPVMGMSSSRNLDAELIKHFTVVHWDQRGAGKSYNSDIPISSMTFDRLVEDCNELIDYLRNRFHSQKVFIVAHSGGTSLGIKTACKYPEKIHAYVGVAQVINDYEQQKISYDFVVAKAEKSEDIKIQNAIKAIGPPPYDTPEKEFEKAKYILRYGGFVRGNLSKHMGFIILSYLTSPEYSLSDAFNTLRGKGLNFTSNAMYEEIKNINFAEEIRSIKIPVFFFQGKYDMIIPTVQIEEFYSSLEAEKGKKLIIFENSAHLPIIEEKEKYEELLVNVVLKESRSK